VILLIVRSTVKEFSNHVTVSISWLIQKAFCWPDYMDLNEGTIRE
jgi:hypothetical protein